MLKATNTRKVTDLRHYNDQNPNQNAAAARARVPQIVRLEPYSGEIRTIIVKAPRAKGPEVSGRAINGAPLPVNQRVGGEGRKYE